MKIYALSLFTLCLIPHLQANCSDAQSSADWIEIYADKGLRSSDLKTVKEYAKKVMHSAKDAEVSASNCSCSSSDTTKFIAYEAFKYAREAYDSLNLSDALKYLKKAKDSGIDTWLFATHCTK